MVETHRDSDGRNRRTSNPDILFSGVLFELGFELVVSCVIQPLSSGGQFQ